MVEALEQRAGTRSVMYVDGVRGQAGAVVLFSGWPGRPLGLTRSLYGTFPVFRAEFDAVCGVLPDRLRVSLVAGVFAPEGGVDAGLLAGSGLGPVALFAHQVALYGLWREWGVAGGAVAGAGEGVWAAAHAAGHLGLEEAAGRAAGGGAVPAGSSGGAGVRPGGLGRCLLLAGSPGCGSDVGVGDVAGLLAAFGALQRGGPPVDWETVWRRARARRPVADYERAAAVMAGTGTAPALHPSP